jgi:hypothetical protein
MGRELLLWHGPEKQGGIMATMNPQQYARAWNKRVRDYEPGMRREFEAIGNLAHTVATQLITREIYAKPEDVTPAGKPKWRRTNLLAHSEQPPVFTIDSGRLTCTLVNTAVYAEPRHEANKPGRRRINPARTAHWRDDMLAILATEVPERLRRLQATILRGT